MNTTLREETELLKKKAGVKRSMWTEAIREWWELFQREIRDASHTTKTEEIVSKKKQLRI